MISVQFSIYFEVKNTIWGGKSTVTVLHQNDGDIGKSIPDAQEISRDSRDVLRAQPEGREGFIEMKT